MANEFYITAGLPAIDYDDIGAVAVNAFYITAGLVANDYTPAGGTATLIFLNAQNTLDGNCNLMTE